MLTVDHYARIRLAHRDGMSIRAIARTFGHSRHKIRQVLAQAEPRPYTRRRDVPAPKLGPFTTLIDQILQADQQAPRKQRHTATQIFRRLQAEHDYGGGYDQIRRYVGRHRRDARETFIPLEHAPGQRAEADFGQIAVDFPAGRCRVHVLLVTWAYSDCPFALALPTERTEAVLHGLVRAFHFFGCVPRELWWDNPTTVAKAILTGRQRTLNDRYRVLASHYTFDPRFCMPGRGNEKPRVENRVKTLQRRWATPVPHFQDLGDLNIYLEQRCRADRSRTVAHREATIGQRFEQDRQAALALPAYPFDACLAEPRKVDKFQTVAFDAVRYSVPRRYAFQTVTVKADVDHIEIIAAGQRIAIHPRCYEAGQQILDPCHYVATLARKPACLDHAGVFRRWALPPRLERLRGEFEQRYGPRLGTRQFTRVLALLDRHPVDRILQAIDASCPRDSPSAELIIWHTERLSRSAAAVADEPVPFGLGVPSLHVPQPDLSQFDQFLSAGE